MKFLKLIVTSVLTALKCILIIKYGGAKGSSVSLTVEGGVSLVGPHCPGTVRLFCEGVHLVSLRWNFNTISEEIDSFHPDDEAIAKTSSNPAFLLVELTSVSQSSEDSRFANFSSILTVDLSQLEQQHITSIRCGDPGTFDLLPVNVQIYQPSAPQDPQMVNIAASFESSEYVTLTISWEPPTVECPQYKLEILYEAILTVDGLSPITKQTDGGSCSPVCSVVFNVASESMGDGNFFLQLQTRSSAFGTTHTSNVVQQNIFIGNRCIEDSSTSGAINIAAATIVTFLLSLTFGFTSGACLYYSAQKKYHCAKLSHKTSHKCEHQTADPGVRLQENLSYDKVQRARQGDGEQAYSTPSDSMQNKTEPRPHLQHNASYGQVQERKKKISEKELRSAEPEPYEEPIKTRRGAEASAQLIEGLAHSYCEVKEETVKEQESDALTTKRLRLKPQVNKELREGVVSVVGETTKEVRLEVNQSYGQRKRGVADTRPEYDYVDMQ